MARSRRLLKLLRDGLSAARKRTARKLELPDLLLTAGTASIGAGIWMIYPPAALITIGVLLLVGGLRLGAQTGPNQLL